MQTKSYEDIKLIDHLKKLFPLCRSLTGEDTRKTLKYFENYHKEYKRLKFKTGSKVFDWEIPKEWNIKDAYYEHVETGERYAEFKKNNLHIVGYSEPINQEIDYEELIKHIYTHKDNPNWIPYVTSYYKKYWGFCIKESDKLKMKKGNYKVYINSSLKDGDLDLSHALLKGKLSQEILISSYVCHPSMANNELSGPIVLNGLLAYIKSKYPNNKYSYRFVLQPETIGSIAYLSKFSKHLKKNLICGFNLSCVGDERTYSYVKTPFENTLADKAISAALFKLENVKSYSFLKRGSDERQYCAPGIRLPICTFSRSKFAEFPEYHTSADNLDFVSNDGLDGSLQVLKNIVDAFELGLYPKLVTKCEPQLGKRDLYPTISQNKEKKSLEVRMNFLAYCDGKCSIFDICRFINCDLKTLLNEYKLLKKNKLVI